MLVFPTAVVSQFARRNRARIERDAPGCAAPAERGTPGEEAVLRSFSNEWLHYEWDERAYWGQSAEDLFRSMDFALDVENKQLRDKLVLEVGIGIGGIADHVVRTQQCEILGLDLSHAVDAAFKHFQENPFLHVVQASAFAPPFKEAQFDFVYSQGVLHHTYSTRAAFTSISRMPKVGGRLYVWVYSRYDEQRTRLRKLLYAVESAIRPVYSRLPDPLQTIALAPWAPLYILHQRVEARHNPHAATYTWRASDARRSRPMDAAPRASPHQRPGAPLVHGSGLWRTFRAPSERIAPAYVPEALMAAVGVEGVRLGVSEPPPRQSVELSELHWAPLATVVLSIFASRGG